VLKFRAGAPAGHDKTAGAFPRASGDAGAVSAILKRRLCLALAWAALAACTPELDWRELSVPEGHFAVLLPGKARSESRTLATASGAAVMTMYAYSPRRGTMAVAYTDYPAAALAAEHGRGQVDAARDALLRNIGSGERSEEEISIAGFPGRQVYAEGSAGGEAAMLKARFVVVGSRLYQIAYVGAKDGVTMADVDMFLTSFKLLK
jgi:hypothetical protein